MDIDDNEASADEPFAGDTAVRLYQTVYCSRAADGVGEADVDRIIASAQRRNPACGVTGLLVFGSGLFFQWLEGPRAGVALVMGLIRNDARHRGIVTLSESEEVRERLFPEWTMERVSTDDLRAVLVDALDQVEDPSSAAALGEMLERLEIGGLGGLHARALGS